jgi:hypothetical protein
MRPDVVKISKYQGISNEEERLGSVDIPAIGEIRIVSDRVYSAAVIVIGYAALKHTARTVGVVAAHWHAARLNPKMKRTANERMMILV